ncbi:hypothetical protein [Rhizobium sp. UBA1881]|uniref:hypothetical protein n=2 Tax=unclassified Rhizobium TaxID=2613769 RepID=UPI0013AF8729|nr:hypothetical protein [Rhizobium sp. UBA1881]
MFKKSGYQAVSKFELSGTMRTKIARIMFLVAAMMFFAVLALDIAVPALVLGLMALSTWLVSLDLPFAKRQRGATA